MIKKPLVIDNSSGEQVEIPNGFALFSTQVFRSDFVGNLDNIFGTFNTGAGSSNTVNSIVAQNSFGLIRHATGTTATGTAGIHSGQNMTNIGGFTTHTFGGKFRLPALSTAAQRFTIRSGLSSSVTSGAEPTNGVYIRYVDNVNSGRVQLVARRASVESVFNSTLVFAANDWVNWVIVLNTAATRADLYLGLNGNALTFQGSMSVATSIPLTTTTLAWFEHIQKSVGTTTSLLDVDLAFYDLG